MKVFPCANCQRWKNVRTCEHCSCKMFPSSGKILVKFNTVLLQKWVLSQFCAFCNNFWHILEHYVTFFVFFALFGSFWFFYAVFLQIRFVKIYAPFRIKSFWLACVKSCIFASLLIVCYIVYNFLNLHDKKYLNCYPWHSDCPDITDFKFIG